MGVFANASVPEGHKFGPVPATITLTDPAILIGHMTCDVRPNIHTVELDILDYQEGARLAEWIPYVQAAREECEQNLEALLQDGQLFYHVSRPINAGEELLVWYSREYSHLLGIPELQNYYIKEGGIFCCPNCTQRFRFPNSLRAHMRFKCERRHLLFVPQGLGLRPHPSFPHNGGLNGMHMGYRPGDPHPGFMYQNLYNMHRDKNSNFKPQPSPTSSVESIGSGDSMCHGVPSSLDNVMMRKSPEKRKLDSPDWVIREAKRSTMSEDITREASPKDNDREHDYDVDNAKFDLNKNLKPPVRPSDEEFDNSGSAFRKVEKQLPPVAFQSQNVFRSSGPPNSITTSPYPLSPPTSAPSPAHAHTSPTALPPPFLTKPEMRIPDKSAMTSLATLYNRNSLNLMGQAMMPPVIPSWNFVAGADLHDRTALNAELLKAGLSPTDLHNIENANPKFKMPIQEFPSRRMTNILPYYRSSNPMVEKLIQSALTPLTVSPNFNVVGQNWCAKCNATFRMTSDLVYHMRSHHSKEFDHLKKKREDKLKCTVCGETFRERHHLTRHMTSHAEMDKK